MSIIGHQRETIETGPKQDWLPQQEHVNFIRILWSLTCGAPLWMTRGVLAVVVAGRKMIWFLLLRLEWIDLVFWFDWSGFRAEGSGQ